ncbi:hypothetical protein AJ80_03499 [Polytolypa hystricis UAMH7299]|uniref:Uncharacterized protein n=1 Tax=Polytolypa hystricis (strain UAMH7299) TaxID=1447883 RepID=A0A2B7YI13_POLH7|nr:hypothetical protein AJ80_03499 [Polytolypa hystricis UAMH7299]
MSPINSLWFKWKSLKLPWRKTFPVGEDAQYRNPSLHVYARSDLSGNTFWEFKDAINAGRMRRIVKANPKTHYADVKISPQWHQWLRNVRENAPTIDEQKSELLRQAQMKQLAQLADERWASKPSYLDKPQDQQQQQQQQPAPATQSQHPSYHVPATPQRVEPAAAVKSAVGTEEQLKHQGKGKKTPWAREAGGPSEKWQPEAWTPSSSKR